MTTFNVVPSRSTRLRVIFSEPMQKNASLLNRTLYAVSDLNGSTVSVTAVAAEQATSVRSVVLDLGLALVPGRSYQVRIASPLVVAESGGTLSPTITTFRWVEGSLSAQIPISRFSGEAVGGLFGPNAGVFFSPALQAPAANSVIQVDQVDVCTRAYDEYQFPPQGENTRALMTHGVREDGVIVPFPVTTLNSSDALWAAPSRGEFRASFGLSFVEPRLNEPKLPVPVEGPATVTIASWPPGRIALLNSPAWKLFDNQGGSTAYFITADNLTPLGADVVTRTL